MKLEHNVYYKQLVAFIKIPRTLDDYFSMVVNLPVEPHLKYNYLLWRCSPEKSQRNLIEYDSLSAVNFDTTHPSYLEFPKMYRTDDFRNKIRDAQFSRPHETQEKMNKSLTGQKRSLTSRQKMSESHKGKIPWNKGKAMSMETCEKIRQANIGKKQSQETRKKRQMTLSKLKWFNNGVHNVRRESCPDGYVSGRVTHLNKSVDDSK